MQFFYCLFCVSFWMEEDTSPFGCGWLRDQICLFELADYWMRIKIHLRNVDSRFHGENNHNEIRDCFVWGMAEMHQYHSWAML